MLKPKLRLPRGKSQTAFTWLDNENGFKTMVDKIEFRIEGDTITVIETLGDVQEPFPYSLHELRADLMLYALGGDAPKSIGYRSAIVLKALLGLTEPKSLPKDLLVHDGDNPRNIFLARLDKINELLPLPDTQGTPEGNDV